MQELKIIWQTLQNNIIACHKCLRLRQHCQKVAKHKRKAFLNENYWGKPVMSFGDLQAKLMIIGLAPAAHGANRTGRLFTGDRSGEWLYRALYKAGFSNRPTSSHQTDGLQLRGAYLTTAIHCAPPKNKPTLQELKQCHFYLKTEMDLLNKVVVYLALGKIAFDQTIKILRARHEIETKSYPQFGHNNTFNLQSGRFLLASYHPSQQNTFTGKLTEQMFDAVFSTAKQLVV